MLTSSNSASSHAALPRPGRGLLVGLLLLLAVEGWLHSDDFLYRYRSVFAAGRTLDKVLYAEQHCPALLLMGNSRVDNAFDPRRVVAELEPWFDGSAINLGLPGADSRVLAGIALRLDRAGCFKAGGTRGVVLGLDEALVQAIDTLGQDVFFAGTRQLWADGQYHDALRSALRLYGYTANLRQLREPASLQRFVAATPGDVDPVGGSAAQHLGYRAGFGGLQDRASADQQEKTRLAPPDAVAMQALWRLLDLLAARGVRVAVVFPPLLHRDVAYLSTATPQAAPFRAIAAELQRRGIATIRLDAGPPRDAAEFVNAGHLNDRGAQRYSRLLGQALNQLWRPSPAVASTAR